MSIWTYILGIALALSYAAWVWYENAPRHSYVGPAPAKRTPHREKKERSAAFDKVRLFMAQYAVAQSPGRHRPETLGANGVQLSTIRTVCKR